MWAFVLSLPGSRKSKPRSFLHRPGTAITLGFHLKRFSLLHNGETITLWWYGKAGRNLDCIAHTVGNRKGSWDNPAISQGKTNTFQEISPRWRQVTAKTEHFLSDRDLISTTRMVQITWKTLLRFKSYLISPKGVGGELEAGISGVEPGA
jgi:hypothetical protein